MKAVCDQCEVIPADAHTKKMKRLYQGLKPCSAQSRGAVGKRLVVGEGKEEDPMPFELYQALCKYLVGLFPPRHNYRLVSKCQRKIHAICGGRR